MIGNGNEVDADTTLEADLCIVGAGAAGIAIAHALVGSKLRVIVLESGGLTPDPETQRLYQGEVAGMATLPLEAIRLRYFGGTTNHWAGWCRPLDPEDFEVRSWVPDSGWPITREDLDPWYRRAQAVCDLGPYDYTRQTWGGFVEPLPKLSDAGIRLRLIQHSPPTRFGEKFRDELSAAQNIQVLLESNLLALVPDGAARTVLHADVATLQGRRFRVMSRKYVLACGTIENARLLLSSDGVVAAGLGNDRDLVGRYFMDHPRARPAGAALWSDSRATKLQSYSLLNGVRATLAAGLSPDVRRRDRLTNCMVFALSSEPLETAEKALLVDPAVAEFLQHIAGKDARGMSHWWVRCEQSPNRDSRVTLGAERDALGLRRPVLDWRVNDIDRHTLATASRLYAQALTQADLAHVRVAAWLLRETTEGVEQITGDWHQMGTTRMADAAQRGVVDSHCRVFGIDNLFVAGGSVFPTGGAMNPTLTIVALALRLADHLAE